MDPQRWDRIRVLFHEALAQPEVDRASFVARACPGDDTLRQQVESLLAAHAEADDHQFLTSRSPPPPAGSASTDEPTVPRLAPGTSLGPYEVIDLLGRGGMGEVYRARDQRLGRDVAVKVLPGRTLAADATRLRTEATTLARLNHPHIAAVHDLDTRDGTDFLVMEYVPGTSLADRLTQGGLPEREVVRLGIQVAAALEEAHEHHVVHRDLKPANIRLSTKGDAVVVDFGLAKQVAPIEAIGTGSLMDSRVAVGTLPYMAPEQLRGSAVDARSDIYALGCVLYEMATGQRPFRGEVSAELGAEILESAPPPPVRLNPALSPELQRMILRCLEKDPEKRFQSAKELADDLRQTFDQHGGVRQGLTLWRGARLAFGAVVLAAVLLLFFNVGGLHQRLPGQPAAPQMTSLAVLPLENLSPDSTEEYVADGMTDVLIADLAQISGLRVISRTSAIQYKGTRKPLRQIAQELGVSTLVEGSMLQVGRTMRVSVQLVDGATDRHLWARTYEREVENLLALQREIAHDVAREIQVTLTPAEEAHLRTTQEIDPDAYRAYLQGRYYLHGAEPASWLRASRYFEAAVAKEPDWAEAHGLLGRAYHWYASSVRPHYWKRSKQALLRALALDDGLAQAHGSLGFVLWHSDWNWAEAENEFGRALELDPNESHAQHAYGLFLASLGRFEEAISMMQQAEQADPLHLPLKVNVGGVYDCAGQSDRAIRQLESVLELEPDYSYAYAYLFTAYLRKSAYRDALAMLERYRESPNQIGWDLTLDYAHAYARMGQRDRALAMVGKVNNADPVPELIETYTALGETENALSLLERAYEERVPALLSVRCWPEYDKLRREPRFQALLRQMSLPIVDTGGA